MTERNIQNEALALMQKAIKDYPQPQDAHLFVSTLSLITIEMMRTKMGVEWIKVYLETVLSTLDNEPIFKLPTKH